MNEFIVKDMENSARADATRILVIALFALAAIVSVGFYLGRF